MQIGHYCRDVVVPRYHVRIDTRLSLSFFISRRGEGRAWEWGDSASSSDFSIKFLGQSVDHLRVRPDLDWVSSVLNLCIPTCVRDKAWRTSLGSFLYTSLTTPSFSARTGGFGKNHNRKHVQKSRKTDEQESKTCSIRVWPRDYCNSISWCYIVQLSYGIYVITLFVMFWV